MFAGAPAAMGGVRPVCVAVKVRCRQSQVVLPAAQVELNGTLVTGSMAFAVPSQGTMSPTWEPAGMVGQLVWPAGLVQAM